MSPEIVMNLGQHAIMVMLLISAPLLISTLAIGLVISIFQAATQINEQTLSFIPKLVGIFAILILLGPWMLTVITDYLHEVFESLPNLAH